MLMIPVGKPLILKRISDLQNSKLGVDCRKLLALCLKHSIECYYPVPQGMAVGTYNPTGTETVGDTPRKAQAGRTQSAAASRARGSSMLMLRRNIRYLALCPDDMNAMRLEGEIRRVNFIGSALELVRGDYYKTPRWAAVIAESPGGVSDEHEGRPVPRGSFPPIEQHISFTDLRISADDCERLKLLAITSVPDHWGHSKLAPSVFQMYTKSFRPYDEAEIRDELRKSNGDVFIEKVAEAAARLIKIDVRPHVEKGLDLSKITINEFGKNYLTHRVSNRMALVLYATDRWIHDRSVVGPVIDARNKRRHTLDALFGKIESEAQYKALVQQDQKLIAEEERNFVDVDGRKLLKSRGDLEDFLKTLGFSKDVSGYLARIISGAR